MIDPSSVMIGIFMLSAGYILGHLLKEATEDYRNRKQAVDDYKKEQQRRRPIRILLSIELSLCLAFLLA